MANAVFRFSATMLQGNSEAQGTVGYPCRFRRLHAGLIVLVCPFLLRCFVKNKNSWLQLLERNSRSGVFSWKIFWYWFKCWCFWKIQISQIFYFLIDYDILRNLTISFNGTYISLKTFRTSLLFRDGMQSIAGQTLPLNHILAFFRVSLGCVLPPFFSGLVFCKHFINYYSFKNSVFNILHCTSVFYPDNF